MIVLTNIIEFIARGGIDITYIKNSVKKVLKITYVKGSFSRLSFINWLIYNCSKLYQKQ